MVFIPSLFSYALEEMSLGRDVCGSAKSIGVHGTWFCLSKAAAMATIAHPNRLVWVLGCETLIDFKLISRGH